MMFILFGLSLINFLFGFYNIGQKKYVLAGLSFFAAVFSFVGAIVNFYNQ